MMYNLYQLNLFSLIGEIYNFTYNSCNNTSSLTYSSVLYCILWYSFIFYLSEFPGVFFGNYYFIDSISHVITRKLSLLYMYKLHYLLVKYYMRQYVHLKICSNYNGT